MKKIILLVLLISNSIISQKLSKSELSEKIAESSCECINKQEVTKENLELTFGLCMLEGINKFEKDVEKHYGKNIISNDDSMEVLGKDVGVKMALKCPQVFKLLIQEEAEATTEAVEEESLKVNGKIAEIKSEQFITFSVKEDSGKNNQFILLSSFDNSFLLTDKVLKINDLVEILYYQLDLFDAKLGKFVTFNIVTDIIKK